VSDLVRLGLGRIRGMVSNRAMRIMINGGATGMKGPPTAAIAGATVGKVRRNATEVGGREGRTCSHDWEGRVFGAVEGLAQSPSNIQSDPIFEGL